MSIVNILKRMRSFRETFPANHADEPSLEESTQILKGLRDRYEAHHRVSITDDAIDAM